MTEIPHQSNESSKEEKKDTIFIEGFEAEKFLSDNQVIVVSKTKHFSIKLLKKLFIDDIYISVERLFKNEISFLSIRILHEDGFIEPFISLNKRRLIEIIDTVLKQVHSPLNELELQKAKTLQNIASYDVMRKKYQDKLFSLEMDGKQFIISYDDIFDFLMMDDEAYNEYFKENYDKEICKMSREFFLYAIIRLFDSEGIIDNYCIPSIMENRFRSIAENEKVDIYAINRIRETVDNYSDSVKVNNNLIKLVISGMNEDYSLLEKAIYVYIRLCKLLTYNQEYYAADFSGPVIEKHSDISYITSITGKAPNNGVVCYEFTSIFAYFLKELGISYAISNEHYSYGDVHNNLRFRVNKFIVEAEAIDPVLSGDLVSVKINYPLNGLKLQNINQDSINEFKAIVRKVYDQVAKDEQSKLAFNSDYEVTETFESIILEYEGLINSEDTLDLSDRMNLVFEKLNNSKTTGVDALSYLIRLTRIIFTQEERQDNFQSIILRNNKTDNPKVESTLTAVIVVNESGFDVDPENTLYYLYEQKNYLTPISKEDLVLMFENRNFEYLDSSDMKIPGIRVLKF